MEPLARCSHISLLVITLCLLFFVATVQALDVTGNQTGPREKPAITLFIPSPEMIHSDQILDYAITPGEQGVLFGTSFGLSQYNGTWSTRHINRNNISQGLMDEFITAVEYDEDGNTWIGYSGGIQIYNGIYYRPIRDQQLLKDTRISDLQRWDDTMWIATGNSGIHRYRNGNWTWYQPMTTGGPGFYEIMSMALDPDPDDMLVITTRDAGIWVVKSPADPVLFEQVSPKGGEWGLLQQVRRNVSGDGVLLFNDTMAVRFTETDRFIPVLTTTNLTQKQITINDLASASDGSIYIATDDGIYVWRDGEVVSHISRFEGIGTSEIVRTIFIDTSHRVWFATQGYVGFIREDSAPLMVEVVTPETVLPAATPSPVALETPAEIPTPDQGPPAPEGILSPILDPLLRAITTILSRLGLAQTPG